MPAVQIGVFAEAAFDQAAVLGKADLPRDVEHAALLDGGDVGGDRSRGLRQGDAEFGESIVNAHGLAPSTRGLLNQASRVTVKPAKLWLTGMISTVLMLRCGGRLATHQNRSAISSAVIGSMSA